jgi:hypothetical protein
MSIGSSVNPWNSVYSTNEWGTISDRNKKNTILTLDDRYLTFANKLMDLPRIFKLNDGESGRIHVGFIAQDIEYIMMLCGISNNEFAGLVKEPDYELKLENGEYDKTSPIVNYSYYLRYGEFIPLSFIKLKDHDDKISDLNNKFSILENKLKMLMGL